MATSNRAGHPVRNRKRNRLIYNEDEETSFGPQNRFVLYNSPSVPSSVVQSSSSNKSSSKGLSTVSSSLSSAAAANAAVFAGSSRFFVTDSSPAISGSIKCNGSSKYSKHIGSLLANSLKSFLKKPKAHAWVNHEWFYGNIDQVLFLDENEFHICLRDSFPQLKTRFLARLEWSQIRRLMGKPRRCSAAFFDEERATLNSKRNKIRYLQQNKVTDLSQYKDLPDNIPQSLVVGTQVAALARDHNSLCYGIIEGIDSTNGTYRVSFNNSDVGSLSVPDYEVASIEPPTLVPLSSFQCKTRKIWHLSNRQQMDNATFSADSFGSQSLIDKPLSYKLDEPCLGLYPLKFLKLIVKASKSLKVKRAMVNELKERNSCIERMCTLSQPVSVAFKRNYALSILELEKLNKELSLHLSKMQNYSLQMTADGKLKGLKPEVVGQKHLRESKQMLERLQRKFTISSKRHNLILHLMSLMFHLRGFRDAEVSSFELQSILDTIGYIRGQIHHRNSECFQNNVEIHIRHIMSSVSHLGNVGAFSESNNNNNNNNQNNNSSTTGGGTTTTNGEMLNESKLAGVELSSI